MEDLIERQAAIDAIQQHCKGVLGGYEYDKGVAFMYEAAHNHITEVIERLPSAQPKQKVGKWVHGREIAREMVGDAITAIFYEGWQCSECKCIVEEEREPLWKFCPNCGAKMEEQDGNSNLDNSDMRGNQGGSESGTDSNAEI